MLQGKQHNSEKYTLKLKPKLKPSLQEGLVIILLFLIIQKSENSWLTLGCWILIAFFMVNFIAKSLLLFRHNLSKSNICVRNTVETLEFVIISYEKEKIFNKFDTKFLWLWDWYILKLTDTTSEKVDTIILDKNETKLLEFLMNLTETKKN